MYHVPGITENDKLKLKFSLMLKLINLTNLNLSSSVTVNIPKLGIKYVGAYIYMFIQKSLIEVAGVICN